MWFSSSYRIRQGGARAALILLTTQLWQGAGRKRPECRIRDSVLPPCRKVHREPFQLLCKNHQPFLQMVVIWSIKRLGAVKKNAVHDFSVFQHFSPFSVQDSGTVPILFAKIIAVRQPHPPPLLWFPPLPPDEPPKLRLNAIMSFRQLFFSGKHVFPVQIHLSTSYSSNKGVLL